MNPNHSLKPHVLLILMGGLSLAGCNNRQYQPADWKPTEPSNQSNIIKEDKGLDEARLEQFGDLTDWTADNLVGSNQKNRKDIGRANSRSSVVTTLPKRNTNPTSKSTLPNRGNGNSTLPARNRTASTLPMRDATPRGESNGQTLPLRNSRPQTSPTGRSPSTTTLPQSSK